MKHRKITIVTSDSFWYGVLKRELLLTGILPITKYKDISTNLVS